MVNAGGYESVTTLKADIDNGFQAPESRNAAAKEQRRARYAQSLREGLNQASNNDGEEADARGTKDTQDGNEQQALGGKPVKLKSPVPPVHPRQPLQSFIVDDKLELFTRRNLLQSHRLRVEETERGAAFAPAYQQASLNVFANKDVAEPEKEGPEDITELWKSGIEKAAAEHLFTVQVNDKMQAWAEVREASQLATPDIDAPKEKGSQPLPPLHKLQAAHATMGAAQMVKATAAELVEKTSDHPALTAVRKGDFASPSPISDREPPPTPKAPKSTGRKKKVKV